MNEVNEHLYEVTESVACGSEMLKATRGTTRDGRNFVCSPFPFRSEPFRATVYQTIPCCAAKATKAAVFCGC